MSEVIDFPNTKKGDNMPQNKTNKDKVTTLALDWLEANRNKNDWNNKERRLKEQLIKEVATGGNRVVDVDEKTEIHVGYFSEASEEIDPKALFNKDPELFWQLVSVPKGAVQTQLGEKEAAKLSRTVVKSAFNVKKVKKN